MTRITTHILDTVSGGPAPGIAVTLFVDVGGGWREVASAVTDEDGRVASLPEIGAGRGRLRFDSGTPFFPEVLVTFVVEEGRAQLHVPLILSPYGYSVYRGS
ncbi:MAG TPA: hydroxyisourate hydrolase [Solirubrobacteraceae bacterium]|nr:hydroxyisourate hydrolase [Solirubrobacteraceae bacterium]